MLITSSETKKVFHHGTRNLSGILQHSEVAAPFFGFVIYPPSRPLVSRNHDSYSLDECDHKIEVQMSPEFVSGHQGYRCFLCLGHEAYPGSIDRMSITESEYLFFHGTQDHFQILSHSEEESPFYGFFVYPPERRRQSSCHDTHNIEECDHKREVRMSDEFVDGHPGFRSFVCLGHEIHPHKAGEGED